MAVTINISVGDSLAEVLKYFDKIQILRAPTATDTFVEITTASTRPTLNNQDTIYQYTDSTGTAGLFYKTRYYNSSTGNAGPSSATFVPIAADSEIDPAKKLNALNIVWDQTSPLAKNMQVTVTLSSGIADVYGDPLGTDISWYFLTKLEPLYASFKELDLEIGSYISDVPQDTIYLQILKASLEADAFTFATTTNAFTGDSTPNTKHFSMIRKNWTLCRAEELLLLNQLEGTAVTMKRLADLTVTYRPDALRDAIQRAVMCKNSLEGLLNNRGDPQVPITFIKGIKDPDRPAFGRGALPTSGNSIPAANISINKVINPFSPHKSSNRFSKTYIGRRGGIEW